jgi:hypothetical protein
VTAVDISGRTGKVKIPQESGDRDKGINDKRFINQLDEVRKLKDFLFEEKVQFKSDQLDAIDLGPLNSLSYRASGREPEDAEWKLLDEKLSNLTSYLDENLRPKIRIRELSRFFGLIPLSLLLINAVLVMAYALFPLILTRDSPAWQAAYNVTMLVWTIAQGGLGSCAYLGTRVAIKKAQGATESDLIRDSADITDINVLKIRIILGALFAFIIGLPVSFRALQMIYESMNDQTFSLKASDVAVMLVPFLLGFSTNWCSRSSTGS